MLESDTVLVFRILGVLARAGAHDHPLPLEQIAEAVRMRDLQARHYLTVLHNVGVVRAEDSSVPTPRYRLSRYGLERLETARARETPLNRHRRHDDGGGDATRGDGNNLRHDPNSR
jgi:DNA-binding IclR family transcriptional regulator